jgi:hypothetical protein
VSLIKTTKPDNRQYVELKKHPVQDALPAYFEKEYPKFNAFLERYYDHESEFHPADRIEDFEYKRDFVGATDELLRFFSQELLLGRDYFDMFVDKQTAVQSSNLLYRSKGSRYSIQQFFRVFFGFDIDLRYGRDEVFLAGDPNIETSLYTGKVINNILWPGNRIQFHFDDGDIQVWANAKLREEKRIDSPYFVTQFSENPDEHYVEDPSDYVLPYYYEYEYNRFYQLDQDIDYTINYSDKSISFIRSYNSKKPGDPWIDGLAQTGVVQEDQSVKVVVKRYKPAGSALGDEVTQKRITNNGFWQLYALHIRAPIGIKTWKEAYKDFVHPSGMYLESSVLIETESGKVKTYDVDMDQYRYPVHGSSQLVNFVATVMTELNIDEYKPTLRTYSHQGYVLEDTRPPYEESYNQLDSDQGWFSVEQMDSDRPDEVYRSRINDLTRTDITLEGLDTQYIDMAEIDDINARRFDLVTADLSNTFNTLDENLWHEKKIGRILGGICPDQHVLGNSLDFPPEYPGCPGFIFGVGHQIIQGQFADPKYMDSYPLDGGQNDQLVAGYVRADIGPFAGVARAKRTAYRDARVYGYTNNPANMAPNPKLDYTTPIPSPTPSSQWEEELDFVNDFQRAQLTATVHVYTTYFNGGYIDSDYLEQELTSST